MPLFAFPDVAMATKTSSAVLVVPSALVLQAVTPAKFPFPRSKSLADDAAIPPNSMTNALDHSEFDPNEIVIVVLPDPALSVYHSCDCCAPHALRLVNDVYTCDLLSVTELTV